jgi:hypothetical protein
MSDFNADLFVATDFQGLADSVPTEFPVTASTIYFKMIGQDHNNNNLDTWRVTGAADNTGAQYVGALTLPLRNIAIAAAWTL